MKRITFSLLFILPLLGFAQEPLEKIKTYASQNRAKFSLTNQDVSDLVIVNEFSSESTGINNYHVKQRHNGIEVFNSDANFWIKNGEVINGGEEFISNIAAKISGTAPTKNVEQALLGVMSQIGNEQLTDVQILESKGYDFKLTNGVLTEDAIRAELVYFQTAESTLKLAWDYEFYSQNTKHLWNLKVDAITGILLEKQDLVISCNFSGNHSNHSHGVLKSVSFSDLAFKNTVGVEMLTPGTTNYRVIPWNYESPNHSPRVLITNPESTTALPPNTNAASPNGWHNTNNTIGGGGVGTQFNNTRGNNVLARDDVDSNNGGGTFAIGAGAYPNLTFDFAYPGTSVAANTYLPAAITNLFYMNNIMHDLWYQYGFDEANKNFQVANYGRGGLGNDAVQADAQDGGGVDPNINNANFSITTDGTSPRMQMYLWNVGPTPTVTVATPSSVAGLYTIRDNNFNPGHVALPVSPATLNGQLVLYADAAPDTSDACTAPINGAALNGKIAVIRRGTCTFIEKVLFAQNAGAIAVIVVNNVDGTIVMGGADASVTIPAVSINMAEGEALIAAMGSETLNVSLTAPAFVNTDGDLDNGIIAHEYGHGISSRLSGTCLGGSEQMGEGWSDWFWLIMQIKPGDTRNDARGIGTFAANQPTNGGGIRQYRYSTDMAINPHTYGSTNQMYYNNGVMDVVDTHSVGSVWAVVLWDLAWNYIDKYGYNSNIYNGTGGNNKVMRLVLDAIKLDGCNPTLITGRDALIAADQATTGGQDYCMIWETFARRGLGVGASSGASNSGAAGIQDQTESFVVPPAGPNCTLAVNQFHDEKAIRVYPNPSNGMLNIAIHNYTGKLDIQVFDLNGRKVYQQEVGSFNAESTINLSNLQSGMYMIKMNGENLNYTEKIILN
ncbi:T9SS-dependent M36 family metallopeptidase [Flavobacterium sp.]|uniref:T9SS-dependent M36 family metallopeptidase n=1 Tax=Flavobacterium sp. TaxID=239 RepID=UPI0028BD2CA9|nr:T9SS-dependent M36 family metallopeptidase [Flavobacterium sp.]